MTTPICDFVAAYTKKSPHRAHMPGHKGADFLGFEHLDITEIAGADVLYCADGIILESRKNAASLFGTAQTLYSAEGSSLSVRAMLYLVSLYAAVVGEKPLILAGRNAHKVFVMSCALVDFELEWLYGQKDDGLAFCEISAEYLDKTISEMPKKPTAVYITSPDYLGNIADVAGISKVCRKHGVLLAVDNAHGAYLKFLPQSRHPIDLGADICCDSAHKTLPVITGGGYLHISKNAPAVFAQNAERAMALFASTSPSYLILQSLDYANKYISDSYRSELAQMCRKICALKEKISSMGFETVGGEPLKITVKTKSFGYYGFELASVLESEGIYCEFCDPDFVVLMLSTQTDDRTLECILKAMSRIPKKEPITRLAPKVLRLERAMSPREAMFCESADSDVASCAGHVLADPTVSCPPAIPIAVCGEILDEKAKTALEYYGVRKVKLVRRKNV